MSRMDELLVSAASSLKEGYAPLSHQWLVDNDVSIDEAHDVAETIATAIHVYRAVVNTVMRQGQIEMKKDRTLPEIVESMVLRHRGAAGALIDGIEMEQSVSQPAD